MKPSRMKEHLSRVHSDKIALSIANKKMDLWIQTSSVISKKASISTDQPEATKIGLEILQKGGNAADAAVAAILAVSVLQPLSCGVGGDCHCLFFRKSDNSVRCLNGSGRTGKNATLDQVKAAGIKGTDDRKNSGHGMWVSVPGTVAGMCNTVKHFGSGKLSMKEILEPVVKLTEEGAPLTYKHAALWKWQAKQYKNSPNAQDLDIGNRPPGPGDIIRAPKLARCFKEIGEFGPQAFYIGQRAKNIAEAVQQAGGVLTEEDLADHLWNNSSNDPSTPLSVDFQGVRIWEMRPNTLGVVPLVAFNILKAYDLKVLGHNSAEYIHLLAEASKHAYQECWEYLCDPDCCTKKIEDLLNEETAERLRRKINIKRASRINGFTPAGGNTSIVTVADEEGNGCSLVCSVSRIFGTGIIPDDCGFVLHDRARSLNLKEGSSNVFGPRKLPLHSILPLLITDSRTDELLAVMGVIGRYMQPQGHVQVLVNMLIFGMDPQVALSQPRFFIGDPKYLLETYKDSLDVLCLEGGIDPTVIPMLESKGHTCRFESGINRIIFGYGHVIARPSLFGRNNVTTNNDVWWSGADPRTDGCAMGY